MKTRNSILTATMLQKCPRCREGRMFQHAPYSPGFMQMNAHCSKCGLDFLQEPSFYFGAMYFSYAIQVVVFVLVYLVLRFTIDPGTWTYVIYMVVGALMIAPINYRWSRVAWLAIFVRYEPLADKNSN
jgi:uncharacterized protein (DUF983 family)